MDSLDLDILKNEKLGNSGNMAEMEMAGAAAQGGSNIIGALGTSLINAASNIGGKLIEADASTSNASTNAEAQKTIAKGNQDTQKQIALGNQETQKTIALGNNQTSLQVADKQLEGTKYTADVGLQGVKSVLAQQYTMWNRDYDIARSMGLYHPAQIGAMSNPQNRAQSDVYKMGTSGLVRVPKTFENSMFSI